MNSGLVLRVSPRYVSVGDQYPSNSLGYALFTGTLSSLQSGN